MFEVRCLVGDKTLHKVLHSLGGLTIEPPVVLSVAANDTDVTPAPSGKSGRAEQSSHEALRSMIIAKHLTFIKPSDMREYLVGLGFSRNAYSHALNKLLEAGFLKKSKSEPNTYEVINNG